MVILPTDVSLWLNHKILAASNCAFLIISLVITARISHMENEDGGEHIKCAYIADEM